MSAVRAGQALDDYCAACKIVRRHTVLAASPEGVALRVVCDYCGSQHNYRGGGGSRRPAAGPAGTAATPATFPLVGERERSGPPMSASNPGSDDLELLLRRIIREECGLTAVAPADRWRGGELVLRPGRPGVQEKTIPVETFFHKIVMIRNRLRVLEQQVNALEVPTETKLKLQGYVTGCYGTLTSFNVLFAEESDRFRGSGGE